MNLLRTVLLSTVCIVNALKNPVILVPGITGNGLMAEMNHSTLETCGYKDYSHSEFRLWIQFYFMLPKWVPCWAEMMRLKFDGETYHHANGMKVFPDDFGGVRGVEYLNYFFGYGVYGTKYMADMIYQLEKRGLERNKTIFGAPYDWRLPFYEIDYERIKKLIEYAVDSQPEQGDGVPKLKAQIVAHSQGTLISMWFLHKHTTPEWRDQYIDRFVPINGVFGGSFKSIKGLVSGYAEMLTLSLFGKNSTLVDSATIREIFRSFGSGLNLLPNTKLWGVDHPVISGDWEVQNEQDSSLVSSSADPGEIGTWEETFSLQNWTSVLPEELGKILSRPKAREMRAELEEIMLSDPKVPVQCLYSTFEEPTTDFLFGYKGTKPSAFDSDPPPRIDRTHGDNVVPMESTQACGSHFSNKIAYEFKNMDHMLILQNPDFIIQLTKLLDSPVEKKTQKETSESIFSTIGSFLWNGVSKGMITMFYSNSKNRVSNSDEVPKDCTVFYVEFEDDNSGKKKNRICLQNKRSEDAKKLSIELADYNNMREVVIDVGPNEEDVANVFAQKGQQIELNSSRAPQEIIDSKLVIQYLQTQHINNSINSLMNVEQDDNNYALNHNYKKIQNLITKKIKNFNNQEEDTPFWMNSGIEIQLLKQINEQESNDIQIDNLIQPKSASASTRSHSNGGHDGAVFFNSIIDHTNKYNTIAI